MADVVFGYVYDFGPGEEWVARRAARARCSTASRWTRRRPSAARATGGSRSSAIESADPRWLAAAHRRAARRTRTASARDRLDRGLAVPGRGGARRRHGVAVARAARSTPRRRSSSCARAAALVAFPGFDDPLGAPLDLVPHSPVVAARTARGRSLQACPWRSSTGDWRADDRLGPRRRGRRLRRRREPAGGAGPARRPRRRSRATPSARVIALHRLDAARRRCRAPEAVARGAWVAREPRARCATSLDPLAGRAGRLGPLGAACARSAAASIARGGRRARRLPRAARARPVRARAARPGRARRGCCSSRPTSREAARHARRRRRRAARAGSRSTRSRTRVQFTGVPWLREHLAGLLRELLEPLDVKVDPTRLLRLPSRDDLRAPRRRGARGRPHRRRRRARARRLLDRVQATMALIEGHAEHVMDAVGARRRCRRCRRCARRSTAAARERSPLAALLERLLGLEMKLRQYEVGKRFCDAVVERDGRRGAEPGLGRARGASHARRARGSGSRGWPNARSAVTESARLTPPITADFAVRAVTAVAEGFTNVRSVLVSQHDRRTPIRIQLNVSEGGDRSPWPPPPHQSTAAKKAAATRRANARRRSAAAKQAAASPSAERSARRSAARQDYAERAVLHPGRRRPRRPRQRRRERRPRPPSRSAPARRPSASSSATSSASSAAARPRATASSARSRRPARASSASCASAATACERDVKQNRTRVEREVKRNRTQVERQAKARAATWRSGRAS